jgi:hypothetical protein
MALCLLTIPMRRLVAQGFPLSRFTVDLSAADLPTDLSQTSAGEWTLSFQKSATGNAFTLLLNNVAQSGGTFTVESQRIVFVSTTGSLMCTDASGKALNGKYQWQMIGPNLTLIDFDDQCRTRRIVMTRKSWRPALALLPVTHDETASLFQSMMRFELDSLRVLNGQLPLPADVSLSLVPIDTLVKAAGLVAARGKQLRYARQMLLKRVSQGMNSHTAAVPDVSLVGIDLNPAAVIAGMVGLDAVLTDLMNQVDVESSNQLFSMRSYVAASIEDLNLVFKDRLTQTFDQLNKQEKEAITQAQVISSTASASLERLQEEGFAHAQSLVCDATAQLAAFPAQLGTLALLPGQQAQPDLFCVDQYEIRDPGTLQATLLRFRGANLLNGASYPDVSISVPTLPGTLITIPAAGGGTTLLTAIPGKLNGDRLENPGSVVRADIVGQIDFHWPAGIRSLRWLLTIKPYVVSKIQATITPLVDQAVYSRKSQICYVFADKGFLGGHVVTDTCRLPADLDAEVVSCSWQTTTANGDQAGIVNSAQNRSDCEWEIRANSGGLFGEHGWFGGVASLVQRTTKRIPGPPFSDTTNLATGNYTFTYPLSSLPAEGQFVSGSWQYKVHVLNNVGEQYDLTDLSPVYGIKGQSVIDQTTGALVVTILAPSLHRSEQ